MNFGKKMVSEMMFAMCDHMWREFGEEMDKLNIETRDQIAYNIRCYDYFLTFPDDAPKELMEIVKRAAGEP